MIKMSLPQRYELLKRLQQQQGRQIWLAQDNLLGTNCVVKLAEHGNRLAQSLLKEGLLLSKLSHPRLLRFHDQFINQQGLLQGVGSVSGFSTAYFEGRKISTALKSMEKPERLKVFTQLIDVIDYLHRSGLLHLDIKPDNILWNGQEIPLLDLGTAQSIDSEPGAAGGTLGYAAPEVVLGEAASVGSDIYSLGAILYEILTGHPPFSVVSPDLMRQAILHGRLVPVQALRPDAPEDLSRLAEQMLARSVTERPTNLNEVMRLLQQYGVKVS